MWKLDSKESWALKNLCFQIVVLEKTLESPLDCKEIKPVNPKGNHPWIFTGRTDAEAQAPYSQSYGFSSSHVWIWELDHKEGWAASASEFTFQLEGLMLKLQYFGPLMEELTHWKRPWCWERLKAGGGGDDRGWDGWMASLIQWTWVWADSGTVKDREAWHAAGHGVTKSQTRLNDWTTKTSHRMQPSMWPFLLQFPL